MYIVKRPVSATVIGWISIVFGGLQFAISIAHFYVKNTSYVDKYVAIEYLYIIIPFIALVSGIALLKGKRWSKLILSLICIALILGVVTDVVKDDLPTETIIVMLPVIVILIYLQSNDIKHYLENNN